VTIKWAFKNENITNRLDTNNVPLKINALFARSKYICIYILYVYV